MARNYRKLARRYAKRHGINPDYFERQIDAESGFNPGARSPAGATGIAQIMPGTARGWGVNPNDPAASLNAAAKNMRRYLNSYGGDWNKALAAYNAGPGAVQKYGGVPPYRETKNYISKILRGGPAKDAGGGGGGGGAKLTQQFSFARQDFDQKGFDQAKQRQLLAKTLAEGSSVKSILRSLPSERKVASPLGRTAMSGNPLFKTGLLSTEEPSRAQFTSSRVETVTQTTGGDDAAAGTGKPDGKVRAGGGYMGTQKIAESAGAGFITSGKRTPAQNAAAGGAPGSDHLTTKKNAYAVDLKPGDDVFNTVKRRLGLKGARPGSYQRHIIKINGRRYSVQLLWRVKGHDDHNHLGIQAL